jgi:alanyl aminopeptidase
MRRPLALAALVFVACGPPPAPPPPPAPQPVAALPPPPEPRADGRLPPLVTPRAYELAFDVDPRQPRFTGKEQLDVDVPAPTAYVVLNAHGLHVTRAAVQTSPTETLEAKITTRIAAGGKTPEELVLALPRALGRGEARIFLEWDAPFDDELSGLYRVKAGDQWYAYTQFEATDARRAFPCFDEPDYKVPYTVTVSAPRGMLAVANGPETAREDVHDDAKGDKTTFHFAPTPPLPSYLVALAVGDFDVREATGRAAKPPIRLIAPKGTSNMGALALEAAGALVDGLGDWFGIPYPFDKLDIVAVPDFAAGAMENAGLVTFRQELLLLDPARASVRMRRAQALVMAHELAHQWFGNLVTAAWWNDLWLNEGMATWMESRAVDRWRPAWGALVDAASEGLGVMDQDALASARAVRQPVVSTSEADEAFDGITYEKGAAVMQTIQGWIGEEAFRRGLRDYLQTNARKSVHADALLSALDRASGKDVSHMAATFLDRPGVPVVSAQLSCERGARWSVELGDEAWHPLGSTVKDDGKAWVVPVCVLAQGEKQTSCTELVEGAPALVAGRGCPAWVHPNASSGYYRFDLAAGDLAKLAAARTKLDVPQRVSLLSNAWASVRAGSLKPDAVLKILPSFDDDGARQVVDELVGILVSMNDALVEDASRAAFQKLVLARFGKRKKALGWTPKKDEASGGDDAMLRRSVLWTLGELAEDDATLKEADDVASKWLVDPSSVDADAAAVAVDLASRHAGPTRITQLRVAAKGAKTDEDRIIALRALGGFDDPKLLESALDVVLTDEVKIADVRYVMGAAYARKRARPIVERWTRARWDELRKKLPGSLSAGLVRGAGVACTKAEVDDATAFYTPRAASIDGATRRLAEALEGASLCAELRRADAAALTRALTRGGAR